MKYVYNVMVSKDNTFKTVGVLAQDDTNMTLPNAKSASEHAAAQARVALGAGAVIQNMQLVATIDYDTTV